ncbi:Arc family DNA-binding protein [Pseudochrobactrum algeriensis]|uniref:Arc family DNA-binding protein n=1 Tax=Pseudochrobactrum algeriensis TaxID=2834768 RepID=UPI001BCCA849|nr:Arc family DNA-binding protein [Pseudochrobactrum algeriensis]
MQLASSFNGYHQLTMISSRTLDIFDGKLHSLQMNEKNKYPSEIADRFQLRLPPGLRDRIKVFAEAHGRSMNTEIVRVLEKEFPEPMPLDVRLNELLGLFTALRKVRGHEDAINELTDGLLEAVEGIASGRVPDIDEVTRQRIRESLDDWHLARIEEAQFSIDQIDEKYTPKTINPDLTD